MLPRIIFDTSAINALENGGAVYEPLMKGLVCGFDVILTGMSAGEIMATPKPKQRKALLSQFNRLLSSAKCIWPPNEIIRLLVLEHCKNPSKFDWMKVDVRARIYEAELPRQNYDDDELSAAEKYQQRQLAKNFERFWKELRLKLDRILAKDPSKRPNSYREAITFARRDGGVLWGIGEGLYQHVSGKETSEADIRSNAYPVDSTPYNIL